MSGPGPEPPDAELHLVRYIVAFAKDADEVAFAHYLAEFSEAAYAKLFDVSGDRRLFDVYPIAEDTSLAIEALASIKFDLSRYDYFLECGTTNDPEIPGEPVGPLDETTGYPPPLDLPAVLGTAQTARPRTSAGQRPAARS